MADARRATPMLEVRGLDVYYGRSHALQGVDLTLDTGVLSVIGRNGMGKTTLCKTIMGLVRATSGSVLLRGEHLLSLQPPRVAGFASVMCRNAGPCGGRLPSTSSCA